MRESLVSLHTMGRIFLRRRKTPGHKDAGRKAKSKLLSPSEVDRESVWHGPGKCAETWVSSLLSTLKALGVGFLEGLEMPSDCQF